MAYILNENRYSQMEYRRCGNSGLKLPLLSLGLWHNFGDTNSLERMAQLCETAFDGGITHFDLANNYGPPAGAAERNFGRLLKTIFAGHRDELVISTKAGYDMWDGPYGDWGSRKYLLASLDQSLKRLGVDYVDIFYHHRPDPETPIEETMGALDQIVRSGKALYVGISRYTPEQTEVAIRTLRKLGTPMLIHQENYSMLNRKIEAGLTDVLTREGVGLMAFGPLAGGRLTGKYQAGIPADSRIGHDPRYLKAEMLTPGLHAAIDALTKIADARGETLSQLALQWALRDKAVTSALIGASRAEQITENVAALSLPPLTGEELAQIDAALALNE